MRFILHPRVALWQQMSRQASSFLFSSACSKTREEGTLTGVLVLVSTQVADFCICFLFFFLRVVSYAERCGLFIYSAGCRW